MEAPDGVARLKGAVNPAQGNALGISFSRAQALKGRRKLRPVDGDGSHGIDVLYRLCVWDLAPSGLRILGPRYPQGVALGCTIFALQAAGTQASNPEPRS